MTRFLRHCLAVLAVLGGLAAIISSSASAQDSSPTNLMAAANDRYERGEYTEAAQQYEALIDMGYSDAALYFNLGNTYLESEDLGRAILSYLRALVLSPRDPDILNNLDLARSQTVDQIEVERVSLIESFAYLGRRALNPGELGLVSLLALDHKWPLHRRSDGVAGLSVEGLTALRDRRNDHHHTRVVPAAIEHAVRQPLRKHRSRNRSDRRGLERAWYAVSLGIHASQWR